MSTRATPRIAAIDLMRGWVMVLMAVDHGSMFFNAGRVARDSAGTWVAGSPLPLDQFLLRWVTHLCAPAFLFLAGVAMRLSVSRRREAGTDERAITRDLVLRGAIIAALDLSVMSALGGLVLLQVLYAIGLSMILLALLRPLPDRALLAGALAWMLLGEVATGRVWQPPASPGLLVGLAVAPHSDGVLRIVYPVVPWLAVMMLGWVFGGHLERAGAPAACRTLLAWGLGGLAVFVAVRAPAGYGNLWLQRADGSLAQWLHVSKYPPSLAFYGLELGLVAILLALLLRAGPGLAVGANHPLVVFGQTALFFYLAHFLLLGGARGLLGDVHGGIPAALAAATAVLVVLYPVCRWYRGVKAARPDSLLRFL